MGKIILLVFLLLINAYSFSQEINEKKPLTRQDYLNKSKKQNKTGIILLSAGGGLIATSFIIPRGELVRDGICIGILCDDEYKNDGIKSTFFIAGGLAALSSIPFFTASGKNRRRAASVNVTSENAFHLNNRSIVYTSFPALKISVHF